MLGMKKIGLAGTFVAALLAPQHVAAGEPYNDVPDCSSNPNDQFGGALVLTPGESAIVTGTGDTLQDCVTFCVDHQKALTGGLTAANQENGIFVHYSEFEFQGTTTKTCGCLGGVDQYVDQVLGDTMGGFGADDRFCYSCVDSNNGNSVPKASNNLCPPPTTPTPTPTPVLAATAYGDPHYVCPSGEKFDFEGVQGKYYSLVKDTNLAIDVGYTTGDAALNTVAASRKMLMSAEEQNSVYTYMNDVKITLGDNAIGLQTELLDHTFTMMNLKTGALCAVGTDCDLDAVEGFDLTVADVGPCKFHRPGRKLLPKNDKALIRDRMTESSCQALTVTSAIFEMTFTFVPAGEINGSAGVNYLDLTVDRITAPTPAIDGIVGQCYNSAFPTRFAAFPDFLKTKYCDTCEMLFEV